VLLGELEHLKNNDEVNRRHVCECDGCVCVLEVIGTPSMLRFRRKAAALARVLPTFESTTRSTRRDGSGKVHCWFVQAELLKLQKRG
jgi:hypothetical protein